MVEQLNRGLQLAESRIVDSIANFLPGMVAFLVVLLGSIAVAVVLRVIVRRALAGLEFDRRVQGWALGDWAPSGSASATVAGIAFWTVVAMGLLLGLTTLDAALPTQFAVSVLLYVPQLLAGLAIIAVGVVVSRFLARSTLIGAVNMGIRQARAASLLVKWLVLIIAVAMALDHVGIGRTVLLLAFGILFGGVVLAAAIAVGLGARDAVARAVDRQLRDRPEDDQLDHV